ncbi:hypothetical protein MDA_GLEAN10024422 [Myotis davidii]|uniref:Uncharacterized protein n=1 Tax=Myotis davidii TaxID=225400 RepID=L5LPV7_MYODS|nr:hypothetical protein MDA_GLEAN10024422 [Myotis davidii]
MHTILEVSALLPRRQREVYLLILEGRAVLRRRNPGPVWGCFLPRPRPGGAGGASRAGGQAPSRHQQRHGLRKRRAPQAPTRTSPLLPQPRARLPFRSTSVPGPQDRNRTKRDASGDAREHARTPPYQSPKLRTAQTHAAGPPITAQTHASRIALRHIRPADLTLKSRREWAAGLRPNRVPIGSSITARIPWTHVSSRNPAPSGQSDPPTAPAGCNPLYCRSPWVHCPFAERGVSL